MMPRLTAITLGVRDVPASWRFYEALGFVRKVRATGDEIVFLDGGGTVIALWGRKPLTDDVTLPDALSPGQFGGVTLAWNCQTPADVDAAYVRAIKAGAKAVRHPGKTDYGGYRGYFADPDGHMWEVVHAPGFAFTADGRLVLPD